MRQIPHLPSLTMCTWLRFLDFNTDVAWRMVDYVVSGTRSQVFSLFWKGDHNRPELHISQGHWTGEKWTAPDRWEAVTTKRVSLTTYPPSDVVWSTILVAILTTQDHFNAF